MSPSPEPRTDELSALRAHTRGFLSIETLTLLPSPVPYVWRDDAGVPDLLLPYAGRDVLLPDGRSGTVLHSAPGCPAAPWGGRHRYVVPRRAPTSSPSEPSDVLCFHVSWLRPLDHDADSEATRRALRWGASWVQSWLLEGYARDSDGRREAAQLAIACYPTNPSLNEGPGARARPLRQIAAIATAVHYQWGILDAMGSS